MGLTRRAVALTAAILGLVAAIALDARDARAISAPTFTTFASPGGGDQDSEPTIAVNPITNRVMMQAGLDTYRVENFNDRAGTSRWTSVEPYLTRLTSLDPILFTDRQTGRTFVSQLTAACSLMAFTDDDGESWTQNPAGCGVGSAADHQSVGGGPFAPPLTGATYPNAVYYCGHVIVNAHCALSLNGGLTFGPAIPLWSGTQCVGGHGHLQVGPDGTVYVPHSDCGTKQAIIVSTDNGLTWSVRPIPDSREQNDQGGDPAAAVGPAGTLYFGYRTPQGKIFATVSRDAGVTWSDSVNVSTPEGIRNVKFPTMVAGDDDRAALAFLGTRTGGNDQAATFEGKWHLYVAVTYDRGKTWTTVKATDHPVQIGPICMAGITCPSSRRNLLDFMDVTVDRQGRILVGYSDGCLPGCTSSVQSTGRLAVIARQSTGTRLFR